MLWYVILIIVGLLLWLNNLGYHILDLGRDWPLLLVLIGIWGLGESLWRRYHSQREERGQNNPESHNLNRPDSP